MDVSKRIQEMIRDFLQQERNNDNMNLKLRGGIEALTLLADEIRNSEAKEVREEVEKLTKTRKEGGGDEGTAVSRE